MLNKITRNEKGFSLIELMVVLVIVGILTGLMVPNVTGFIAQQEINEAAQKIAGALRTAKEISITRNVGTAVTINPNGRTYTIYRQAMPGEIMTGATLQVGTSPLYYQIQAATPITVRNNIGFQTLAGSAPSSGGSLNTTSRIVFSSRGTADISQGGTIYLQPDKEFNQNKKEKMRAITVSASTGRARIYNWNMRTNKWE